MYNSQIVLTGQLDPNNASIIILDEPYYAKRLMNRFKGKVIEIAVKLKQKIRTNAQNRYLWAVPYVRIKNYWFESTGEKVSKDDIHLHNLQVVQGYRAEEKKVFGTTITVFHRPEVNIEDDSEINWVPASTSNMPTGVFSTMLDSLRIHWGEKGCPAWPDPQKDYYLIDYFKEEEKNKNG